MHTTGRMVKIRVILRHSGTHMDFYLDPGSGVSALKLAVKEAFKLEWNPRLFVEGKELDESTCIKCLDNTVVVAVTCASNSNTTTRQLHMEIMSMPDDNSCLFHAIRHSLAPDFTIYELRHLICESIRNNPSTYSPAVLGKPQDEYISWIGSNGWGGGIELAIFSSFFSAEIAVVDIHSGHVDIFGECNGYNHRVYLLYSGIHYDLLSTNNSFKFSPNDSNAYTAAISIASDARAKHQYTDLSCFKLKCEDCGIKLTGHREAEHHAEIFGHVNFKELS